MSKIHSKNKINIAFNICIKQHCVAKFKILVVSINRLRTSEYMHLVHFRWFSTNWNNFKWTSMQHILPRLDIFNRTSLSPIARYCGWFKIKCNWNESLWRRRQMFLWENRVTVSRFNWISCNLLPFHSHVWWLQSQ